MNNNSLQKSINGEKTEYKIIDLEKYNEDVRNKIKRFKKEAKKIIFAASAALAISSTMTAPINVDAKPAVESNKKNSIKDTLLKMKYKSFCLSIIIETKKEYKLLGKSDDEVFTKLAEIANSNPKGVHDFLVGSYGFLYGYDSEEFKNILEKMNGYNYGLTDEEKIKELYDKNGGYDFQTNGTEGLYDYCQKYYENQFYANNISECPNDLVLIKQNTVTSSDDYSSSDTRMVNIDLIEEAKEILMSENIDYSLYQFYMLHNETELNKLLDTMSYIESKDYKTLEEYVHDRGFDDIVQWSAYASSQNDTNKRGM